jgi:hypothetical protein
MSTSGCGKPAVFDTGSTPLSAPNGYSKRLRKACVRTKKIGRKIDVEFAAEHLK